VVIAEDEALIRLDLAEMLTEEGYVVAGEAGDGEQAVELARTLRPDLVIMDIKMPKVDGIEVLRELKAHAETRAIPVVVMTSSNEERDVVEAYRLGANSYIVKPVEFETFLETVSKIGLYWLLTNRTPA
jgi:DNA-binding NarL/FixJ family response regulator